MTKRSKFYDIIPKDKKSIRNIPIPEKGAYEEDDFEESREEKESKIHRNKIHESSFGKGNSKGAVKKHDHKESSSVEIKKLERPITNVSEYDEDEYIEIIDHKTSDDDTVEEVHMLGENKEEIEKNKIPELALTEDDDFNDYIKKSNGRNRFGKNGGLSNIFGGFFKGSYKLPILILLIAIAGFFALDLISSASVAVKTENFNVPLSSGYKFDKGDGEVIQSTSTSSVNVPASGTVRLDKKSTGTVVIFNNTSASQKLTKGTRLQASNGLIYLLNSAVVVPAKKTVGKNTVLGSVTTTITAEAVGEKYNSGPKDFTFIGFKGTAKFETIYGRSKGSITGGYSGEVPNISQKDLGSQIAEAKETMKETLLSSLKKEADSMGLIINEETLQYKIINSEARLSGDKKEAVVKVDGSLQATTFLNASMAESAKTILGAEDMNGFKYEVDLSSSTLSASKPDSDGQITITGDVQLKVSINKSELAKSLENKTKKEALSILQQTKGVIFAQIKMFPFWKMTLPKGQGITILVQD